MRPNAIIVNDQVVATNLTPKEQDIYGYGELAGEAKYRDALREKVEALLKKAERMEWDRDVWLAMAYRDVLALMNGAAANSREEVGD